MKQGIISLFILSCIFVFLNCSDQTTESVPAFDSPEATDDGWETATPAEMGLNETPLDAMLEYIDAATAHSIHSITIVKDNKIVLDEYFFSHAHRSDPPRETSDYIQYNRDMPHYMASVSKSITSVVFGNAILNGFISQDVQKLVSEYLPQYSSILTGQKANLTVEHLLTMTSGLNFDETTYPYGDYRNDVTRLFTRPDPIEFVLSNDMHAEPGAQFHYNSGVTNVLAEIIRNTTEMNLLEYAEGHLYQPLGITDYSWERLRGEYYFASGGCWLRPRDLAKFGYLFLNDGLWNGQQIISTDWINASKAVHTNPQSWEGNGYGYQWWSNNNTEITNFENYYFAAGYGGQYMFINESMNMIIVFTGGYFGTNMTISPFQLLTDYIVRSTF